VTVTRDDLDRIADEARTGRAALHRGVDGLTTQLAVMAPRVDRIEGSVERLGEVVVELGRSDVRVETQLEALTGAIDKGQIETARRHSEVLGMLQSRQDSEDRASEARWAIVREPRTQALIAVVLLAVLAPQAIPAIVELVRGWFAPG